jgi:division protein CdvB (Snf7/Vps24/ESCRT-III family)
LIVSQRQTLKRKDLILRLQSLEKERTEQRVADTIRRMMEVSSKGIKSDEIRKVIKIIEDQEFPNQLVKRLAQQPGQLISVYGI